MLTINVDWTFLLVTTIVPVILLFIPLLYTARKVRDIYRKLTAIEGDTVQIRARLPRLLK